MLNFPPERVLFVETFAFSKVSTPEKLGVTANFSADC
jgi:hypothetical protein